MWLNDLLRDLRHGTRVLLAKPGFTAAVVMTVALGIGANTLVFTLINALYLNPLPYRDADALVDVYASYAKQGGGVDAVSIPDYLDLHRSVPALADSALYTNASFNLVDSGAPERLRGLRATASLFSTLSVAAALGRPFNEQETIAGRDHVVVLTDALWRNHFNADPGVLGRVLRLDGESYHVIGVMAPAFRFPSADIAFLVPFSFDPGQQGDEQRGENYSAVVARLAHAATLAQVEAQGAALARRNVERVAAQGDDGDSYARFVETSGFRFGARSLREQLTQRNAHELMPLQAAVALVLLIACANIANLLLTRLTSRRHELAVRTALGATRARIVRELSVETLLLAFAGALAGIGLAWFGVRAVAASGLLPDWAEFALDGRVLVFAFGTAIIASVIFGAIPIATLSRAQPQSMLREGGRLAGSARNAQRIRSGLVVVQLALAVALLAAAGLLLRSFANALAQSPGFVSENVLVAGLTLPPAKYADATAQAAVLRRMLDAVQALPGVTAAGATTRMPFSGENGGQMFRIAGRAEDARQPHAALRSVDENFFKAMGIPILRGRIFERADWDTRAKTVVVDESFEKTYFPDGNAVGQRIFLGMSKDESDPYTIVGVVANVKHFDLTVPANKATFYFNLGTRPGEGVHLVLHTSQAPALLADAVRAAIRSVDAEQPLFNIGPLDQRIRASLAGRRVPLLLVGLFAAAALLLAAIGIYGVLAFGVAQRRSEIGVRLALGATPSRVLRWVLADGARLIAIGLALGIACAIGLGQLLRGLLFGVGSVDPVSLIAVALVFAAIALLACWLPARRAASTDPIEALRYE